MKIKRSPEDFLVEEIMSAEAAKLLSTSAGDFALLRVVKRGLATDEMIARLAAALGAPRGAIGYGGLKDKHAVATQYASVPAAAARILGPDAPDIPEIPGVRIEIAGFLPRPFGAKDVSGNRFELVLRDLTRHECSLLDERRRFLSVPGERGRTLRFVDYFGGQRFGPGARGGDFAARHLVAGEFEKALRLLIATSARKDSRRRKAIRSRIASAWGRWKELAASLPPCPERSAVSALARGEGYRRAFASLPSLDRQMTVEAYQSYLWNETARRLVRRLAPPPLLGAPSSSGALLFPETARVPEPLASLRLPLLSPKTRIEEPWRQSAEETLSAEGIDLERLAVPGIRSLRFGELERRLFVEAERFALGPAAPDETGRERGRFKRRVRFHLPRGAYATVLLAALGARDQNILT